MTTGPVLGTSYNSDRVNETAKEVGFTKGELGCPLHEKVNNLRLQIHPPCFIMGVEGIVTEIEFDDITGRYPNNPEAIEVLNQLYQKIPDLKYLKGKFMEYPQVVAPLSELLASFD